MGPGCNECGTVRGMVEAHAESEGLAVEDCVCCEDGRRCDFCGGAGADEYLDTDPNVAGWYCQACKTEPECEGCHQPRATYWWAVTGYHQCAECHAQGEADILAREAAEAADESEPECTDEGCPEHGMNPRKNGGVKVLIGRFDW